MPWLSDGRILGHNPVQLAARNCFWNGNPRRLWCTHSQNCSENNFLVTCVSFGCARFPEGQRGLCPRPPWDRGASETHFKRWRHLSTMSGNHDGDNTNMCFTINRFPNNRNPPLQPLTRNADFTLVDTPIRRVRAPERDTDARLVDTDPLDVWAKQKKTNHIIRWTSRESKQMLHFFSKNHAAARVIWHDCAITPSSSATTSLVATLAQWCCVSHVLCVMLHIWSVVCCGHTCCWCGHCRSAFVGTTHHDMLHVGFSNVRLPLHFLLLFCCFLLPSCQTNVSLNGSNVSYSQATMFPNHADSYVPPSGKCNCFRSVLLISVLRSHVMVGLSLQRSLWPFYDFNELVLLMQLWFSV